MEVDVDGTMSYPEPQVKDNGKFIFKEMIFEGTS